MTKTIIVSSLFLLGLVPFSQLADATHVTPTLTNGNPRCSPGLTELKIEGSADPTSDGTLSVILSPAFGVPMGWLSNILVEEVYVKGGPNANFYDYGAGATGDTGLVTPTNPNNQNLYGLSHILFCYSPPQPFCGNGIVEAGEQCDDGNIANGDGCSATCQSEVPPSETPVGGQIVPIESTALLLAGAQSTTWLIPLVLSAAGIGLVLVRRK